MLRALAWGTLFFSLVSCQPSAEPVFVSRVLLNGGVEFDRFPEVRDEIRNSIETFLASESSVVFGVESSKSTHRLKVRIESGAAAPRNHIDQGRRVEVTLTDREGVGPVYRAVGNGGDSHQRARSSLTGFRDAWARISQQRRVNHKDIDALIGLVSSPEAHLKGFALDYLSERRLVEAVPALSKQLNDETDPDTLLRIVGALAEIGDERAVRPLIELTRRKDDHFVLQVIYAVGTIGGRTAEGFLVTIAGGHGSEHVRQVAEAMLNERGTRDPPTRQN